MEAASSTGLLAGFIAFISLFVLKPVAVYANLLDKPDHRKLHKGAIPVSYTHLTLPTKRIV